LINPRSSPTLLLQSSTYVHFKNLAAFGGFYHKGTKTLRHKESDTSALCASLSLFLHSIFTLNMNDQKLSDEEEYIGKAIVHSAYLVHSTLGPGLLEKIYEICLTHELTKAGLVVERQVNVPLVYDNIVFEEGLRLDLLVNGTVVIELKAVDTIHPIWEAQIISQLRLTDLNLGYLINFNVALIKNGIRRFRN
jgi:GxxExxY protein